jgi:signal transduction histidine kinase
MHPPSSLAPIAIREDGLGLINMRARARQLNGTFELNSELGRGTTVRVTIPFRQAM